MEFINKGVADLPLDIIDFYKKHNGGEGFFSDQYVVIWPIDKLVDYNDDYQVKEFAPGFFMFGSNGAGEGYGFDLQANKAVVMLPFIGMNREYALPISKSFSDLLLGNCLNE